MNCKIRKMIFDDIDAVLEIEQKNFTQPWTRDHYEMEIIRDETSLPLVAVIEKKVVGYIVCWYIIDEIHIATLSIHKDFQRKHIAEVLLKNSLTRGMYLGYKYAYLEVRESNIPAIRLYQKFGFQQSGIRTDYYRVNGSTEDAILMTRYL